MTQTFNMDCYDYMKSLPDNAFDLVIADPPLWGLRRLVGGGVPAGFRGGGREDTTGVG